MNKEGIKKHKAVFDAWLDGAEIQARDPGDRELNRWVDIEFPTWLTQVDYRVKPKPVTYSPVYYNRVKLSRKDKSVDASMCYALPEDVSTVTKRIEEYTGFIGWATEWTQYSITKEES
jgi:hypothetical protein